MRLVKITIDNKVKYIPQSEETGERDFKPNTIKNISIRKKNKTKNCHNRIKSSLKIT